MNDHERSRLTATGEARREQMLDELLGAMQQIHHGRRVRRRVGSAFAVLVLFAATVWVVGSQLSFPGSSLTDSGLAWSPKPTPNVPEPDSPSRSSERTGLIRMVGDDELVTLLAQLDRPAGIVRSNGEIWLTNAVTDAELGLSPMGPPDPSTM